MNVIFIQVKGSSEKKKKLMAMPLTNTGYFVTTYILCQNYSEGEISLIILLISLFQFSRLGL